jgi:hypothetical protein
VFYLKPWEVGMSEVSGTGGENKGAENRDARDHAAGNKAPENGGACPPDGSAIEGMLGLTPAQQIALQAMAAGANVSKAARAAGVTRQTIYAWRRTEPRFDAALEKWRHDALVSAQGILVENVETAAETLADAVSSDGYLAYQMLCGLSAIPSAKQRADAAREQ